jgi:hypothetical protein
LVIAAAAIVLIPNAPLGLMTLAVQVLAGVLLPSATVFLLLLCNDKALLGPWINRTWLNVVASLIIGVLVMLSLILASTVLFPALDAVVVTAVAGAVLVLALVAVGLMLRRRERQAAATEPQLDRSTWRMPPLFNLAPPEHSRARNIGLLVLRGYLLLVAVLVGLKFAQLIGGLGTRPALSLTLPHSWGRVGVGGTYRSAAVFVAVVVTADREVGAQAANLDGVAAGFDPRPTARIDVARCDGEHRQRE